MKRSHTWRGIWWHKAKFGGDGAWLVAIFASVLHQLLSSWSVTYKYELHEYNGEFLVDNRWHEGTTCQIVKKLIMIQLKYSKKSRWKTSLPAPVTWWARLGLRAAGRAPSTSISKEGNRNSAPSPPRDIACTEMLSYWISIACVSIKKKTFLYAIGNDIVI